MTDITELTSVQKNANIHRLSRLIAYASNDEMRQMAVEVEHYTDQLIEALEKAQQRIAELESRTVTFKLPSTPEPSAFAPWVAKAFYRFHKDTVKSCVAVFSDACRAAGIKVEVE